MSIPSSKYPPEDDLFSGFRSGQHMRKLGGTIRRKDQTSFFVKYVGVPAVVLLIVISVTFVVILLNSRGEDRPSETIQDETTIVSGHEVVAISENGDQGTAANPPTDLSEDTTVSSDEVTDQDSPGESMVSTQIEPDGQGTVTTTRDEPGTDSGSPSIDSEEDNEISGTLDSITREIVSLSQEFQRVRDDLRARVDHSNTRIDRLASALELSRTDRVEPMDILVVVSNTPTFPVAQYRDVLLDVIFRDAPELGLQDYRLGFALAVSAELRTLATLDASESDRARGQASLTQVRQPNNNATESMTSIFPEIVRSFGLADGAKQTVSEVKRRCVLVVSTGCTAPTPATWEPSGGWKGVGIDVVLVEHTPGRTPDLARWSEFCANHHGTLRVIQRPGNSDNSQQARGSSRANDPRERVLPPQAMMDELRFALRQLTRPIPVLPKED